MRVSIWLLGVVGAVACGTASTSSVATSDAGLDRDADQSTVDDASADVSEEGDGAKCAQALSDGAVLPEPAFERCDGGSYTTAPSGAACNATHIVNAGLPPNCSALPKGTYCDQLSFSVPNGPDASALPASFACKDSAYCGWKDCYLTQTGQAGTHVTLDDAALEAACAVTAAYPDIRVKCTVFGP